MGSVPADRVREILRFLDYEMMPGSNNPTSEFWISSEGVPFFFPYYRKGDRDSFLEGPVRDFILGLSPQSLSKLKDMLEKSSR